MCPVLLNPHKQFEEYLGGKKTLHIKTGRRADFFHHRSFLADKDLFLGIPFHMNGSLDTDQILLFHFLERLYDDSRRIRNFAVCQKKYFLSDNLGSDKSLRAVGEHVFGEVGRPLGEEVPDFLKEGRDAVAGAACSRELLEEDDLALELWVDRVRPITPAGRLDLKRLKGCPRAVLRRALYRWLLSGQGGGRSRFGPPGDFGDLSRQGFSALLDAVEGGRPTRQSLGAEGFAVIGGGWLFYARTRG